MKSKKLILTHQAKDDIRGIRRYIAQENPQAAQEFVADLTAKMLFIAETDFTGSPRDHVAAGLRALPYRRRCIYFRSYPDHVVIVRVLHGAQDVESQSFD